MKRYAIIVVLFSLIVFAALTAAAAPVSIVNSKHNLSGNPANPSTYKSEDPAADSSGTDEICVFCHTPHGGNTEAPLWNRNLYQSTPSGYTPYTSDVLSALSYTAMDDPYVSAGAGVIHVKTRICLSCHDGTIAMGNLVNLPYGKTNAIPIQNTGGTGVMPATAAGYIGVNFRDDHPVAVMHDNAKDLELEPAITSDAPNVNLYRLNAGKVEKIRTAGSANYVECTSCHDPHDNQYGNFLVDSNQNSKICTSCHRKTGFTSSIHETSGQAYQPPDGAGSEPDLGNTVGTVKCMNCHFPHKAGVTSDQPTTPNPDSGKYLLSFREEASCFNNTDRWGQTGVSACHGTGAGAGSPRNIESEENNNPNKRHFTGDANPSRTGVHEATEGQASGWIHVGGDQNKWHVECADCHNPHTAGNTNHALTTNGVTATSPLYGAGGVDVSVYPNWAGGPGTYSYIQPIGVVNTSSTGVDKEYNICLKCHSDFAWSGGSVPNSSGGFAMTNQALEFGNSTAFHPVINPNSGTLGTMRVGSGWSTGSDLMYCSDCHTKENGNQPLGPHGSGNNYILKYPFSDTRGTVNGGSEQPPGDLCFDCHDVTTYLNGGGTMTLGTGFTMQATNYNLHARHAWLASNTAVPNPIGYKCVNCHARIPHGFNEYAMIVINTDPSPYVPVLGATITAVPAFSTNNYVRTDCSTVNGCHQ